MFLHQWFQRRRLLYITVAASAESATQPAASLASAESAPQPAASPASTEPEPTAPAEPKPSITAQPEPAASRPAVYVRPKLGRVYHFGLRRLFGYPVAATATTAGWTQKAVC